MSLNLKVGLIDLNDRDVEKFEKIFQASHSRDRKYELTAAEEAMDIVIASSDEQKRRAGFVAAYPSVPVISVGKGDKPDWSIDHVKGLILATRVIRILDSIDVTPKSLPSVSDPSEKVGQPLIATGESRQSIHVLIVDDNEAMQKQIAAELSKASIPMTIDYAFSGEETLEKVRIKKPELIFLDVMMPGMDGYETCKRIRRIPGMKDTPVLMLSGKNSPLDELKGVMAGCTDYFAKTILADLSQATVPSSTGESKGDASSNVFTGAFHVMVVDDSEMMQKQLAVELNKVSLPLSVDYAFSGEEALEKIAQKKPDLVFLDVMMPGIDGYETCTRIRKIDGMKKTPVLMLSGKTSPLDEVKGVMAGATNYITKPIVPDVFQNKLDRVLNWMLEQKQ